VHVVVCTVVHHPADARIFYREVQALLDAGHDVTYIAPHGEAVIPRGDDPPYAPSARPRDESQGQSQGPGDSERVRGTLRLVTIPRASGRRRAGALRAARSAMAEHMAGADLLLVHDPELLLVLPAKNKRPPTVWDVHEDTAAALTTKAWLPEWLRPVAAEGVTRAEHLAERNLHLILAEHGYNDRFAGEHPVVPNATYVPEAAAPPGGPRRVVYVGHISPDRGSAEMTELGRLLKPHGIGVDLIGPADAAARSHIEAAGDAVKWHGFVPNAEALRLVEGALAGLSLLQDEANFRHSMPTKVAEYMARGVPVVTTPLPLAVELVEAGECGFVVPFNDPRAAADAVLNLDADPGLRVKMGLRAHEYALRNLAWPPHAAAFVAQMEAWASHP
jgi:glycosyltransferase involved in cell wall biosynthesis